MVSRSHRAKSSECCLEISNSETEPFVLPGASDRHKGRQQDRSVGCPSLCVRHCRFNSLLKLNEPKTSNFSATARSTVFVPTVILLLLLSSPLPPSDGSLTSRGFPSHTGPRAVCFTAVPSAQGLLWVGNREGETAGKKASKKRRKEAIKKKQEEKKKDAKESSERHVACATTWPLFNPFIYLPQFEGVKGKLSPKPLKVRLDPASVTGSSLLMTSRREWRIHSVF